MKLFSTVVGSLAALLLPAGLANAQLRVVDQLVGSGVVEAVEQGVLTILDTDGQSRQYKVQGPKDEFVLVGSPPARLRSPTEIKVTGSLPAKVLKSGDMVACRLLISRRGAVEGKVSELELLEPDAAAEFAFDSTPKSLNKKTDATLSGKVIKLSRGRLTIEAPESDDLLRNQVILRLAKDAMVLVDSSDYHLARPGDAVEQFEAHELSSGDWVLKRIDLKLNSDFDRSDNSTAAREKAIEEKYSHLSDDPREPRDVRSRHFFIHTDVSDRNAAVLIDKLETMVDLISQYYGRTTPRPIECYVIRDLKQWAAYPLNEGGKQKIARREGVTISVSSGKDRRSTVYSCDAHGVAQHEAVHAFCHQAFGSTGPTWYSEGMAEMGNYWKRGEKAVNVGGHAIGFLKSAEQKPMLEIVETGQITGDSWEAYTWRWALCHLLANNPNYSGRFKQLGIGMMLKQEGVSFESAYGDVARQISFEYDQFCTHVDNGYRADLAAWVWDTRFRSLKGRAAAKCEVQAARGWQPTGAKLSNGESYQISAKGEWKTSPNAKPVTADGASHGAGRLLGVVMDGFELSEPFELSAAATFTAPADGDLYVRCQDAWNQLADNKGEVAVVVRRAEADGR